MADVNFTDEFFEPANPRKGDAEVSAGDGGNARPTADLADVDGHNDGFGEERQYPGKPAVGGPGGSGRGPSQDVPGDERNPKRKPKPSLVAEPNYWGEMAPNTGSHPESGKAPGDVARRRAGGLIQQSPAGRPAGGTEPSGSRAIPYPPGPSKDPTTELEGPETLEE